MHIMATDSENNNSSKTIVLSANDNKPVGENDPKNDDVYIAQPADEVTLSEISESGNANNNHSCSAYNSTKISSGNLSAYSYDLAWIEPSTGSQIIQARNNNEEYQCNNDASVTENRASWTSYDYPIPVSDLLTSQFPRKDDGDERDYGSSLIDYGEPRNPVYEMSPQPYPEDELRANERNPLYRRTLNYLRHSRISSASQNNAYSTTSGLTINHPYNTGAIKSTTRNTETANPRLTINNPDPEEEQEQEHSTNNNNSQCDRQNHSGTTIGVNSSPPSFHEMQEMHNEDDGNNNQSNSYLTFWRNCWKSCTLKSPPSAGSSQTEYIVTSRNCE